MRRTDKATSEPRRNIWRRGVAVSAVLVVGLLLLQCSWSAWNSPYRHLQRGLAAGQKVFTLSELVGKSWRKVCVVPVGGYIWDSDFQTSGEPVADFFNQQFGASRPWGLNSDGTGVDLYVEHEWLGRAWHYIGGRRHPHIKPNKQRVKPPYWDELVGNSAIRVACTQNTDAALVVKGSLFSLQDFESQYRFVRDGSTYGQRLMAD